MADKATLEINGKKLEFPVIKGTENELAIDIKTLIGKEHEGEFTLGGEQKQYILPDVKIQPK